MSDNNLMLIVCITIFLCFSLLFIGITHNKEIKNNDQYTSIEFKTPDNTSIGEDLQSIQLLFPDAVAFRHIKDGYIIIVPKDNK
jgi:hypothetical protein